LLSSLYQFIFRHVNIIQDLCYNSPGRSLSETFWRDLIAKYDSGVLAAWLGIKDLQQLGKIAGSFPSLNRTSSGMI